MRTSLIARLLVGIPFAAVVLLAQANIPQVRSVEPATAKVGDVLTATGENLDRANVAEAYLTDGTNDFKVAITEQAAGSLKVKVTANVKPGRLALMVLTRGREPKLIEQPVKVTIEE
jgi:hypothetical protein